MAKKSLKGKRKKNISRVSTGPHQPQYPPLNLPSIPPYPPLNLPGIAVPLDIPEIPSPPGPPTPSQHNMLTGWYRLMYNFMVGIVGGIVFHRAFSLITRLLITYFPKLKDLSLLIKAILHFWTIVGWAYYEYTFNNNFIFDFSWKVGIEKSEQKQSQESEQEQSLQESEQEQSSQESEQEQSPYKVNENRLTRRTRVRKDD